MAKRINTKFVIILSLVAALLILLSAGAYIAFTIKRNPARCIARAERLISENDYENAVAQIKIALYQLKRDTEKIVTYNLLAETYQLWDADNTLNASDRWGHVLYYWNKILDIDPTHTETVHLLLNVYAKQALTLKHTGYWTLLYNETNEMAKSLPDDPVIKQYRGMAMAMKMQTQELDDDMRQQAFNDLDVAAKIYPDDTQLNYFQAKWYIGEAKWLLGQSRRTEAENLTQQAEQLVRDYIENHPDNYEAILNLVHILNDVIAVTQNTSTVEEINQLLSDLEQNIDNINTTEDVRSIANFIAQYDYQLVKRPDGTNTLQGIQRAVNLLRTARNTTPNDLPLLYSLANLLKKEGSTDDSIDVFKEIKKDRPLKITFDVMLIPQYQKTAIAELGDLYIAKYESARKDNENVDTEWLKLAKKEADDLRERAPNSGHSFLLDGKLALIDKKYQLAVTKLDQANVLFDSTNPDAPRLAAIALMQLGELGGAAQRMEQYIAMPAIRGQIRPRLTLAQLYLRQNDTRASMNIIQPILNALVAAGKNNPDDQQYRSLMMAKAQIQLVNAKNLIQEGSPKGIPTAQEVIKIRRTFDLPQNEIWVLRLADAYTITQNYNQAHQLLSTYYDQHKNNLNIMQQLNYIDMQNKNTQAAIDRINQAIQQNPEKKDLLEAILKKTRGENIDSDEEIEKIAKLQTDPVERQWSLYLLYQQKNQPQKAEEHLAKFIELVPNDKRALQVKFSQALLEKNWEQAQILVNRAAEFNLDDANGATWLGKLQLVKGDTTAAAATFDKILRESPTRSEVWRLLAEARMQLQEFSLAEEAYKQALQLNPGNMLTRQRLFTLYDNQNRHDLALEQLKQLLSFSKGNQKYYENYISYLSKHGQQEKALELRLELAKKQPDNVANHRELARIYLRLKQYGKARAEIDWLLDKDKENTANVLLAAQFHHTQGNFETGGKLLLKHVKSLGDKATVLDWIATARYLLSGRGYQLAVSAYKQAILLEDPETMPATRELASHYHRTRDFTLAKELYKTILTNGDYSDFTIWKQYARMLILTDKLDEADSELKKLLTKYEIDSELAIIKADIAARQNRTDEANHAYDLAVQLAPQREQPYILRAQYHLKTGNDPSGIDIKTDLETAIGLAPHQLAPHELLANWYIRKLDYNSAITELERIIDIDKNYMQAYERLVKLYVKRQLWSDAERMLTRATKQFPRQAIWNQYQAQISIAKGNITQATEYLRQTYDITHDKADLINYLDILISGQQYQQVHNTLRDNLETMTKSPVLQAIRAHAFAMLGHEDQAINAFKLAFDLAQKDTDMIKNVYKYVQTCQQKINIDKHIALIDSYLKNDHTGFLEKMIYIQWIRQGKTDEAINALDTLSKKITDNSEILLLLGDLSQQLDRPEDSCEYYKSVIAAKPHDIRALNNIAYLLAGKLNQPSQALQYAKMAADSITSEHNALTRANVLDTLGWVQYTMKQFNDATETLSKSIQEMPITDTHIHLAKTYIARKMNDEARKELILAQELAENTNNNTAMNEIDQLLQSINSTTP